jgi:hypothetical protein
MGRLLGLASHYLIKYFASLLSSQGLPTTLSSSLVFITGKPYYLAKVINTIIIMKAH